MKQHLKSNGPYRCLAYDPPGVKRSTSTSTEEPGRNIPILAGA